MWPLKFNAASCFTCQRKLLARDHGALRGRQQQQQHPVGLMASAEATASFTAPTASLPPGPLDFVVLLFKVFIFKGRAQYNPSLFSGTAAL